MNFLKNILILLLMVNFCFSCKNENKKQVKTETKELVVNLKKSEFHIKGMTCEIGCARLIQSKLSKVNGINFVKVNFKDSIGMVEYDTNKLSSKDIETTVNNIAGGDLYKVTNKKEVAEFTIKTK